MDPQAAQQMLDTLWKSFEALNLKEKPFEQKLSEKQLEDEQKKLKKKYKKLVNDAKDLAADSTTKPSKLQDKIIKLANEVKTHAEETCSQQKTHEALLVSSSKIREKNQQLHKQKETYENLHKTLTGQYQEQVNASKVLQEQEKVRRQELVDQFQQKIKDIQVAVEEKSRDRIQKEKENEILKEKQREVEKQFTQIQILQATELKKKDIEIQLQEAQFGQQIDVIKNQASLVPKFQEQLEKQKSTDVALEERLQILLAQDKKFTDAMTESNQKFSNYKRAFDNLTEGQKKYDSLNSELKKKQEKSDTVLLDIIEKNLKLKEEQAKQESQLQNLQNLLLTLEKQLKDKQSSLQPQVPQESQ